MAEIDLAAEVAAVIEDNRRARAELIEALPSARRLERWYGPQQWSLHEIVAHLAAWQEGFAAALELVARGERPVVPGYEADLPDADDRFNARAVEGATVRSWESLLAAVSAACERHEAAVHGLIGHLDADRFAEGRAARRLASSSNHDREHLPAILEWRQHERI